MDAGSAPTALSKAPAPPPLDAPVVVEIKNLSTVFGTGADAFTVHKDLNLTVRKGEIVSLVGGSGTGKTVLLRHILGLTQPTTGTVTVLGHPARELTTEGATSRVGACPARENPV